MAKQKQKKINININEENLQEGIAYLNSNALFQLLQIEMNITDKNMLGKNGYACVDSDGNVYLNKDAFLAPKEWAYVAAHCQLHLCFGHFDNDALPGYFVENADSSRIWKAHFNKNIWNIACDIFITKFLYDIKFGTPIHENPVNLFPIALNDERKIYQYLMETNHSESDSRFSTLAGGHLDMAGLEKPLVYTGNQQNSYITQFTYALAHSASQAVRVAGGHSREADPHSPGRRAAAWFIDHYPLFGGLAAHFKLVEDYKFCIRNEISVAAINISEGEIYINPAMRYTDEEWRFILAHEYLHAGLGHNDRYQGRNQYLWNIACDFVINGWLQEMQVGAMPSDGLLYDENLKNLSAESVYDEIIRNLRKYAKMNTLRGYGKKI